MIKKTRWELYKEKVLNFQCGWGVTKDNNFIECSKLECHACCFDTKHGTCDHKRYKWLYEEVEIKHELTRKEYEVLLHIYRHLGDFPLKCLLSDVEFIYTLYLQENWFNGVIDFKNFTFEEVLENHIIVEKEK